MKKSWEYFVPFMFIIFSSLIVVAQTPVVINEIVTDPQQDWSSNNFNGVPGTGTVSNGVDEWVELYIAEDNLNLTGWTIELRDGTNVIGDLTSSGAFQTSNYISNTPGSNFNNTAAGDYLVLGNVHSTGSMNDDILIVLKDQLGNVIDKVELGDDKERDGSGDGAPDGSSSGGNASGIDDESISRRPNAVDTDNDVNDFTATVATMGKINNVNPEGGDNIVTTLEDESYVFQPTDFIYSDAENDAFDGIRIITQETNGDLEYETTDVTPNTDYVDVTKLVFRANVNQYGSAYASFTFKVKDTYGAYSDSIYTMVINVTSVNDPPVIVNIEAAVLGYTENDPPLQLTNSISVSDVDNSNLASAEIQITTNYIPGEDELTFTDQNGISGNWDNTIGKLTLSGSASLIDYQTAIRSVKYHNTSSNPSTLQRAVSFTVNDGTDNSNTLTRTINIVSVNDLPVLSNMERTTLHYTEGDSRLQITDSIEIDDPDNAFMRKAEIQITGNYQIGEDELIFTNQDVILGSWNAVAGKLTLNGTSSLTDYKTAIRSIKYRNSSDNPLTLQRIISFTVNDGTDNSNTLTRTINITSINNAPILTNIETEPLIFTENDLPVQITNTITITDPDNTTMDSAAIQIVNNYQRDEDILVFDNRDEIKGTWNNSSGMLTLKGSASASDYQSALRAVKYQNISEKPDTTPRTITFVVDDGEIPASLFITAKNKSNEKRVQESSNFQQRIINVIAVNDPPELSGIEKTMLGVNEGDSAKIITDSLIVFDKDDIMLTKAEIWIAGGTYVKGEDELISDLGKWNAEKGELTIDGEFSVEEFERSLRTIKYRNTNSFHKKVVEKAVRFKVYDHETGSNELMRIIRVNPENHSPELKNLESTVLKYDLLGGSKNITDSIEINDFDDENINSAGIQISVNYDSSSDSLLFDDFSSIRGVYYKELGRLSLLGKDSRVNYRNALRSVRFYVKNKKVPKSVHRTIQLIVSDGTSASKILQREIEIILPSEAPVVNDLPESIKLTNGDIYKINLWEYVEDKYTPDSLLIFQFIGNNNKISYNYNYSNGELEIKPVDNYVGNAELQIVITNKYGSSIAVKFLIEITDDPLSAGGMENGIPEEYVLYQNFPNPFNPLTKIVFGLPQESKVKIVIYNLLGEEIKIVLNEVRSAGFHSIDFAASKLSSGVYFYRIEAKALSLNSTENFTSVRKMLVVK